MSQIDARGKFPLKNQKFVQTQIANSTLEVEGKNNTLKLLNFRSVHYLSVPSEGSLT